jgi:hypothetical protein
MHRSRSWRGLGAAALALAALGLVGGCGREQAAETAEQIPAGDADTGTPRMHEVAEAWRGSEAEGEWREGYFPIDGPAQLPEGGFREGADQRAYNRGGYTLDVELPDTPGDGEIVWQDGTSLPITVESAQDTLGVVDTGASVGPGPTLSVTGAEAGEMRLRTSRGVAEVPAWHFTIDGYDTPLTVAAVPVPDPLRAPVDSDDDVEKLLGLVSVAEDGRSVTVSAGHGACDDGPAVEVLETEDSIVLAGSIVNPSDGPCTAQLLADPVTVELDSPVGERAMLDAYNGKALLGEW